MNKVINYISYQSFPAETANSLQTISNLKYLKKNDYEVRLFFPLREKNSSDDLKTIQKHYLLNQEICLLYTSPSPRDRSLSRMPSSA